MNDDAVQRLEELAALHSKGDLTDDEFAQAKATILNAPDAPRVASPATLIATAPPRSAPRLTVTRASLAKKVRHDHEKGLWRQTWVIVVAGWCGFMYATVGTAVVPGSGLWTGRLLCGSGFHLASNSTSYSYGTTSGTSITFACVQGHAVHSESVVAVMGLQWLLGWVVSWALIVGIGSINRLRHT